MINLEPIPKKIQERLKEKMNILGRNTTDSPNISTSKKVEDGLTHAKMSTRSTFLRMTSGQLNPVILMGGKLKDDGTIPGGFNDIYGSRTYKTGGSSDINDPITKDVISEALGSSSTTLGNKFKRPTPGVKSVEASFRGGNKATREATISWTCWDWEELDLLTPHFLSHGKTVLVEWGWVYDKSTLQNLPDFIKKDPDSAGNRVISADVYNNYKNKVVDNDGDFDLMVGIVKNFEFTTRDDGGFDCQTIITSVGVNMLENEEGDKSFVDPSTVYKIDLDDPDEVERATKNAEGTKEDQMIALDTTIALKAFLSEIDNYCLRQIPVTFLETSGEVRERFGEGDLQTPEALTDVEVYNASKPRVRVDADVEYRARIKLESGALYVFPNKFIVDSPTGKGKAAISEYGDYYPEKIHDVWVRWGWFEDNILSKFLSLTPKSKGDIVTQFRSVERILNNDGTETKNYQSVKIRNNIDLETVDVSSYILPGQFYPLETRSMSTLTADQLYSGEEAAFTINLIGDSDRLKGLKVITSEKFDSFATFEENTDKSGKVKKTDRFVYSKDGKTESVDSPGKFGYLRNMLINTKVIKQAFGANDLDGKITPINILESVKSMFNLINEAGNLNLWNFDIVQDNVDHQRIKIIDNTTTAVDFNKKIKDQKTKFIGGKILSKKGGIFYFPVWQHDSIVKRQNISAKIPTSLQLATMYGANTDIVSEFGKTDSTFTAEGVAAGAISNSDEDKRLKGLNIAIKNPNSANIGLKSGDSKESLEFNGGEDILTFIKSYDVTSKISKNYRIRNDELNKKINDSSFQIFNEVNKQLYDPSVAPPSADYLSNDRILNILNLLEGYEADSDVKERYDEYIKDIETTFGSKFDGNSLRNNSLGFVSERIRNFGSTRNEGLPLLIPLELELDIDGIGGIYPGNSFHSTYVPVRYQEHTVFQAKDVNHRLDSTGWTTTITGIMRTTLSQLYGQNPDYAAIEQNLENYKSKFKLSLQKAQKLQETTAVGPGDFTFTYGDDNQFIGIQNTVAVDALSRPIVISSPVDLDFFFSTGGKVGPLANRRKYEKPED